MNILRDKRCKLLVGLLLSSVFMTYSGVASLEPLKLEKGARPILTLRNANQPHISIDGRRISVVPEIGIDNVYEVPTGRRLNTFRIEGAHQSWLSSDGKRIAIAAREGLLILDADSGKRLNLLRIQTNKHYSDVISDLSLLAVINTSPKRIDTNQPAIRMWNIESRQLEREYGLIRYRNYEFWEQVTMTRDGRILAATKQSKDRPEFRSTVVWDVKTGRELLRLPVESYWLALSDDGRRLVTCHVVSGGTNRYVVEIVVTSQRELVAEVLPDATPFETRSFYITEVWDIQTGQKVQEIGKGYGDTPPKMIGGALSPDGMLLATESWQYVILWDVRTGEPLAAQLHRENDAVNKVMFSGDGQLLVAGSMGEMVKVWRVSDILEDAAVKMPASDPVRPGKP